MTPRLVDDYTMAMDQLLMLMQLAGAMEVDLDLVQRRHSMAEAVGPILHPSEWMQGGADNLEHQGEVIDAALPFIRKARAILEKHAVERARRTGR